MDDKNNNEVYETEVLENDKNKTNTEAGKKIGNIFSKNKIWIIILGLLFVLGSYLIGIYNNLVVLSEGVESKWAQVDNQYQRRFDLIPNLVANVKGAMGQEQKIFGDLAKARSQYAGAKTVGEKIEAGQQADSAFGRLLMIMENYPALRSIDTVKQLMAQLEGTENRLSVARKDFNQEVRNYNLMVKRFPTSFIAGMFGYGPKDYYKSAEGAENAPVIDYGFDNEK